jgi:hypothetical protein
MRSLPNIRTIKLCSPYLMLMIFLIKGCGEPIPNASQFKTYAVTLTLKPNDPPESAASISTTYNLSCSSVFGGTTSFTENSIVVAGTPGSIQILANLSCTLTIASFFDGTSTYTPVGSALAITISATGQVSSSGSLTNPPAYTNGSGADLYLFLASSTSTSLSFEYAYDPSALSTTFVSSGVTCTTGNCSSSASTRSLQSDFTANTIPSGTYIWFNSAFTVTGINALATTNIFLTNASVSFTSTTTYNVPIPDAIITFSPTAICGSTTFAYNTWQTTVPTTGAIISGSIFLSGAAMAVTTVLPGSIKRVTFKGQFYSDQAGVTISWHWAAAVYSTNMSNLSSLGVKSAAVNDCTYINLDNPGTPENEKGSLAVGGTGSGGTNYTGTYSVTDVIAAMNCTPACTTTGYDRCPLICAQAPVRP